MIAIKDMKEMPKSCVTYDSESDNYTGCPFYKICKQRETIKTNYKPTDCPLVEIDETKLEVILELWAENQDMEKKLEEIKRVVNAPMGGKYMKYNKIVEILGQG